MTQRGQCFLIGIVISLSERERERVLAIKVIFLINETEAVRSARRTEESCLSWIKIKRSAFPFHRGREILPCNL